MSVGLDNELPNQYAFVEPPDSVSLQWPFCGIFLYSHDFLLLGNIGKDRYVQWAAKSSSNITKRWLGIMK